MTVDEQLREWVKGNPIHNDERDECCPDFSCCTGKLAPLDERERFAKACHDGEDEVRYQMLSIFLGRALADKFGDENIYIACDGPRNNLQ